MSRELGSFDIFEDRVLSLLARWRGFRERMGDQIPDSSIIRSCLGEIDDGFTKRLMEDPNVVVIGTKEAFEAKWPDEQTSIELLGGLVNWKQAQEAYEKNTKLDK